VRDHTRLGDAADARAITRYFYAHEEPNRVIAALAPAVLRLATEGDHTAHQVLIESATELLDLATHVAAKLFPGIPPTTIRTGLSGALLTHETVFAALKPRTPLPLTPITAAPIEGVRRLLLRTSIGSRRDPAYRVTMLVRFTKNAPSAKADTLTCIRADGTSTTGPMPKQGVLPHDAIHYVVENTLGWREAFLGRSKPATISPR